ncbi:hypothetical protein CBS101457_000253 [Exobasidium rhododendri]|nr:hypothetical protein CBS101457_000253 [Exobasidium rhododendri]
MSTINIIKVDGSERIKLSEEDCAILEGIEIGCLTSHSDLLLVLEAAAGIVKLDANTYPAWRQQIKGLLHGVGYDRALDMIEGKMGASVEAYQRYFGVTSSIPLIGGSQPSELRDRVCFQSSAQR